MGFLASIAAVVFGWIPDGHFSIPHAFLLCASSVATASIASLVLGKEGEGGTEGEAGRSQRCLKPGPSGLPLRCWMPRHLIFPCLAPLLPPQA